LLIFNLILIKINYKTMKLEKKENILHKVILIILILLPIVSLNLLILLSLTVWMYEAFKIIFIKDYFWFFYYMIFWFIIFFVLFTFWIINKEKFFWKILIDYPGVKYRKVTFKIN
jgi:hypothetical protein